MKIMHHTTSNTWRALTAALAISALAVSAQTPNLEQMQSTLKQMQQTITNLQHRDGGNLQMAREHYATACTVNPK